MLKIGHRGAPHAALENTIPSFRKAIELGAQGIELDVHLCASGELVVFHDYGMDRLTPDKNLVRDLTLDELRAVALPGGGVIPLLGEVLDALGKDIYYFIELKPAEAVQPTVKLMQEYQARGWNHLILISFVHDALRLAPSLAIGATFEGLEEGDLERAKALGARMVLPAHGPLTQAQVNRAHALGLEVVCWTVNEPVDIARLYALGVDGIMGDYPERLGMED